MKQLDFICAKTAETVNSNFFHKTDKQIRSECILDNFEKCPSIKGTTSLTYLSNFQDFDS